jgi:hypothetical protein
MRTPDSRDGGWSILDPLMESPRGRVIEVPPLPRPAHRSPSVEAEALRRTIIAEFWTMHINEPKLRTKEIVNRVQDTYGVKRSYVFEALGGMTPTRLRRDDPD